MSRLSEAEHLTSSRTPAPHRSPAHLTGEPMLCCGVCQYEGRHCTAMAPPGAMKAHLADYRQQGFDFEGFSPEELWTRIRGAHCCACAKGFEPSFEQQLGSRPAGGYRQHCDSFNVRFQRTCCVSRLSTACWPVHVTRHASRHGSQAGTGPWLPVLEVLGRLMMGPGTSHCACVTLQAVPCGWWATRRRGTGTTRWSASCGGMRSICSGGASQTTPSLSR